MRCGRPFHFLATTGIRTEWYVLLLALQAADVVASLVVSLQANQFLQPGTTPFVAAVQTMHSGHPLGVASFFWGFMMSHDLTMRPDGFVEMAWTGQTPWHRLGQQLPAGAPMDVWCQQAGLDWSIRSANVEFQVDGLPGQFVDNSVYERRKFSNSLPNRQVLYRSDTHQGLAVVSDRYKVVQPQQVMNFFEWYVRENAFTMSAAGTMRGGAILWATAQTGNSAALPDGDELAQYVLMSTSCDASSSTEVRLTHVRVVCANTLAEAKEERASVKIRHSAMYDQESVRREFNMRHMGDIRLPFEAFVETAKDLATRQVNARKASDYLVAVVQRMRHGFMGAGLEAGQSLQELPTNLDRQKIEEAHAYKTMMRLFDGEGMGSDQKGSRGTVWGLVNAVTEYVDHHEKGRKQNPADRYLSAWMGHGHKLKQEALSLAQRV
ncbi:DUF932 domain-containing protein [Limnohabitans sp. 2KL-3]|uniref:DUF932 domain-containing protein n=1 Tax=Limnohabitans sp. 2KL-3 TaxID=1100700 RepID=UPI000A94101B|nr:DUF932 domain-containing protein [Limnohabitans sp. 2KL-3]